MLQSMTGFGKSTGTFKGKKVVVEIRTLNSKSLDLYLKLPSFFKEKEIEVRKLIGDSLDRGKVEAIITIENTGDNTNYSVNKDLAKYYFQELNGLAKDVGTSESNLFSTIVRLPDVLISQEDDLEEDDWIFLRDLVLEAIEKLQQFRIQEGASLYSDFIGRIEQICELLVIVPQYENLRVTAIRERMRKGLEEVNTTVDENRFEQELLFYIEKLDITEEKVRLQNHLDYFKETIENNGSVGKKLGFITQEIGREINTLGSKAQNSELQKIVVEMKDNLEKIKEQVLNTL